MSLNFNVTIIQAAELEKSYKHLRVAMAVGDSKAETGAVSVGKDLAPQWQQTFILPVKGEPAVLTFDLLEKEKRVARGDLPVPHLMAQGFYEGAIPLQGDKGGAGHLKVKIMLERF